MITPLESMWLAPMAVAIAIAATFPAWLFGRAFSWTRPGIAKRLLITRSAGVRWAGFVLAAIVAFMLWALGANTSQVWMLAGSLVAGLACFFYAFMIGAGARDAVLAHRAAPNSTPIMPQKLDQMDHELMALIAEEKNRS